MSRYAPPPHFPSATGLPWRTLAALIFVLLGFAGGALWLHQAGAQPADVTPPSPEIRNQLNEDERSTIDLFQRAAPSVVYINSIALRRDFFRMNVREIPRGTGTGFIWDRDGHIITNFHVIQGSNRVQIVLADQSSWDAEVVGVAAEKDLAVLRIDAPRRTLRPLDLGSSSELLVGQQVLAIGNPFGLDLTLTTGIISALGREIESVARTLIRDVIQTDAAINPGNSGGPLLDSSGTLIGVNTAIYSPSGAYAGIGFAIPVDTVKWVVPELIAKGRLSRPALGVEVRGTPQILRNPRVIGALILEVEPGSGAERAGLRPTTRNRRGELRLGDIITAIEGRRVASGNDINRILASYRVGDSVTVEYIRGDRRNESSVSLGRSE